MHGMCIANQTGSGQPATLKTKHTKHMELCAVYTKIMCRYCLMCVEMFVRSGVASSFEVADPTGLALWNMHPLSLPKCSASVFRCSQDRTPATHTIKSFRVAYMLNIGWSCGPRNDVNVHHKHV